MGEIPVPSSYSLLAEFNSLQLWECGPCFFIGSQPQATLSPSSLSICSELLTQPLAPDLRPHVIRQDLLGSSSYFKVNRLET